MPSQRPGGLVGQLGREFAAPDKAGRFKKQAQQQQGQRNHEYGDLSIGLLRQSGGPSRGDTGKKCHGNGGQGEEAKKRGQADFGSSGRRRYVHEIDVAILASTMSINHGNARAL